MAYIKYKELAQSFGFFKELDYNQIPKYIEDYLSKGETINVCYCTTRDKCVFTNRKIILFDVRGIFGKTKKIHFFPYRNISSSAIEYHKESVAIHLSMDSGYQLKLNFNNMTPAEKTKLRQVYFEMIEEIDVVSVE